MKNRYLTLALAALAAGTLIAADLADARRMGGGRSFGTQRSFQQPPASTPHTTPPSSATPAAPSTPSGAAANPVMPAQPGSTLARPAAPAAGAAAAGAAAQRSGMSRWLGPIAGLAAGLGLAALLSHFGLSETFATFLMLALLAVGVVFVLRLLLGRRQPATPERPLSYAGATPPSAGGPRFEPVFGGGAPAAPVTSGNRRLPADFDAAGFMREAKLQFNRLQAAYDAGDRALLADVVTPEMFNEISRDIEARGQHHRTEVVALDGEVLDVSTEGGKHWASVRFHGLTREDGAATPQPFDEVWNLVKPVDGSAGWMLAGIQQLESAS